MIGNPYEQKSLIDFSLIKPKAMVAPASVAEIAQQ
jgi:hypothetical protein